MSAAHITVSLPTCPTCGGDGTTDDVEQDTFPRCPDCDHGKVTMEQLAATWQAVHDTNTAPYGIAAPETIVAYCQGWNALRDHLRSVRPVSPSPKEGT